MMAVTASRPYEKVAIDLFEVNQWHYLVTGDYYFSFIEIDEVQNTLSSIIITKLKPHFLRYEIPETVISDNGS